MLSLLHAALALVLAGPGSLPGPLSAGVVRSGRAAPIDRLDDELRRLGSPTGSERSRAEHWLAVHLGPDDYASLAAAVGTGDAEIRRRIARAVGSDERHFALAAAFASEREETLRTVGEDALASLAARWADGLDEPPLTGSALRRALGEMADARRPEVLELDLARPLRENVELLARHGDVPIGLALGPDVGERARRPDEPPPPAEPAVGPWDQLLHQLAARHNAMLFGHGFARDARDTKAEHAFVRIAVAGAPRTSGRDLLVDWVRRTLGGHGVVADGAATRALAATGWPAALGWLERRWVARGDELARAGLVLAAGRGKVVPSLATPATVEAWLARAESALGSQPGIELDEAHRLLRALERVGVRGANGEDLAASWWSGWDDAPPRGRWLRLVLTESTRSDARGAERAAELLGAPPGTHAPALLLQALRAWTATTWLRPSDAAGPPLGDPSGLLASARDVVRARELATLATRARLDLPDGWRDPGAVPAPTPWARLAVLEIWLGRAQASVAAAHLAAWLREGRGADDDAAAEMLRGWVARGEAALVRSLFDLALADGPDDATAFELERTALLTGTLAPGRLAGFLERAEARPVPDPAILGALGGLGEGALGLQARQNLLGALQRALQNGEASDPPPGLLRALEQVLAGLYAREADDEADLLVTRMARLLRSRPAAPWAARLGGGRWPLPPGLRLRPLAERERRFDRAAW